MFAKYIGYSGRISLPVTKFEAEQGDNPIHKAAHTALEAEEAQKSLQDERNKSFDTLSATIRGYSTVERMVQALPTTEPFTYGIENNVVKLPVVQVDQFNAVAFGIVPPGGV